MEKHHKTVRKTNRILGFILFATGILLILGKMVFAVFWPIEGRNTPWSDYMFFAVGMALILWGIREVRYDPYNRTHKSPSKENLSTLEKAVNIFSKKDIATSAQKAGTTSKKGNKK